jgi:hypothetical protein
MSGEWRAADADQLLAFHLLLAGAPGDRPAPTAGVRTNTGPTAGLATDPTAARALRDVVDSQAEKRSMTTMDYSAMAFN